VLLLAAACAPAAPAATAPAAKPATQPTVAAPAAATPAAPSTQPAAANPATAPEPVTLKMGALRSGSELNIMAAIERGYFAEERIDLQIVDFTTGAQMVPPLATGDLDIASGGIAVGTFAAIGRGIPMKLVANQTVNTVASRSTGWVVRKELLDSGRVRSEADFRGLRVALGGQGTIVDVELDEILRRGGLTLQDVEVLQVPYPDQVAGFANSAIDAAYAFEPSKTRMIEGGVAGMWKYSGQIIEDHESTVMVYGPSMDAKRDAGQRFMVAYLRGTRDVHKEVHEPGRTSDAMLDILVKYTAIKDRDLWSRMNLQWTNPDGYNYPTSIERDLQWFVDNGLLERPIRLADVLDPSYVDYAIQRLGRYPRS
jgi:NitT/TauT family transport system substrate-binding protein